MLAWKNWWSLCVWVCILVCFRKGSDSPQMMWLRISMPPNDLNSYETTWCLCWWDFCLALQQGTEMWKTFQQWGYWIWNKLFCRIQEEIKESEPKQPEEVAWLIDIQSLEFSSVWAENLLIVRMILCWDTSFKQFIQIIHERVFRWKTRKSIAERKRYMQTCTVELYVYKIHFSAYISDSE